MTVQLTRFLSPEERDTLNADAISRGYYRDDRRIFRPGWGWHETWYWDPVKAAELGAPTWAEYQAKFPDGHHFYGGRMLSRFYWETWSRIRPPICVVLPNGEQWEMDRKSSNGEGWQVSGAWPNLTCSPSIAAKGYHGFLQNGAFTPDLDGRAPDGVYPYPPEWLRKVQFDPADPRRVYHGSSPGDPPADYRDPPEPEGGWVYCSKPG